MVKRRRSAALLGIVCFGASLLAATPALLLNLTPSVAQGLYVRADAGTATHVTFCLPNLPESVRAPKHLCGSDDPAGRPVLKRIAGVGEGDTILVEGNPPRPLDSALFGPLPPDLIRGFYRSLPLL